MTISFNPQVQLNHLSQLNQTQRAQQSGAVTPGPSNTAPLPPPANTNATTNPAAAAGFGQVRADALERIDYLKDRVNTRVDTLVTGATAQGRDQLAAGLEGYRTRVLDGLDNAAGRIESQGARVSDRLSERLDKVTTRVNDLLTTITERADAHQGATPRLDARADTLTNNLERLTSHITQRLDNIDQSIYNHQGNPAGIVPSDATSETSLIDSIA
ncbi:hypothetical protein [Nitrosomonas sp.]|uniref:hypothetical protein n=1 Tax=Nitrosomonas sp. TaxID=42353 RepID=UPI0025F095E5|nr:hypothetical protein [Nitrosomonas sp.]